MTNSGILATSYGQTWSASSWTDFYTNGTGGNLALVELTAEVPGTGTACSVAFMVTDASGHQLSPILPLTSLSVNGAAAQYQGMTCVPNGYEIQIYCTVASTSTPILAGATLIGGVF
jgi:hypothetical protein